MGAPSINVTGLLWTILVIGIVLGCIVAAILYYLLPWLWSFIGPWLHEVTTP